MRAPDRLRSVGIFGCSKPCFSWGRSFRSLSRCAPASRRGAQRFGEPGFYDKTMPALLEEIRRKNGREPAEVQALFFDEFAYIAVPAEYFVEHGLRIKEEAHPVRARVVGYANGMVGYVPHRDAFRRGGYEATFGIRSKLAPEAGDLLAEAAIELVRSR